MIDEPYELDPGYAMRPRRSPNEQAQAAWHQVLCVLTMLSDMVHGGAKVTITRSPVFPNADHKALLRNRVADMVETILRDAELVMPEPKDWKCTGGHDLCHGGVSAGPECPYCEPLYG